MNSVDMFDFSGAVIMRSDHLPQHGKPLRITRLWIERTGKWLEVLSYQTAVEAATPAP